MKIIFCKGQFQGPISGADEILVNYALQLHQSEHSVSVLLLYPFSPEGPYHTRLRESGIPVDTIASGSASTFLGGGRKIARSLLNAFPSSQKLIRKNAQKVATNIASRHYEQCRDFLKESRADVVHVMTPDPGAMVMISAAHAAGIPVLYQEVGIPYHPPSYESYYQQFTTVLPLCAEVAALSPRLAQQCREMLPYSNHLSVLPLIMEDFRNGHSTARDTSTGLTIGFAARIEHLKGPMVLLEAFAIAVQKWPRLRLKIAGTGSLEQKFAARAEALGVASLCEFVGVYTKTEQRSSFMQHLDVFALPSLTEGTPNSIVEAMTFGLPVVGSSVGGIPDVVTPDTGILVPPENPAALAAAIIRLAEDAELRARMGGAARERYDKLFSPKVVLPVLLNTYSRMAARDSSRSSPSANGASHPWLQKASSPM